MMPLSEVVFLPGLPARVAAFSAAPGDPVTNPLITFSATGRVGSVGGQVQSTNGGTYVPVTIDPDKPWPADESGQDVRVSTW